MTVAMITVEILVAIGVACIATALLAILTDEGDDEAIGVPQSIAQREPRAHSLARLRQPKDVPASSGYWWLETAVSRQRSSITVGRDLVDPGSIAIAVRPSATMPCHAADRATLNGISPSQ
jgi:hypothetical protein